VTPLQIAEEFLQYMRNDRKSLNAVPELNATDVLVQAKASTDRYASGQHLGI
jgi:hypothetical protein